MTQLLKSVKDLRVLVTGGCSGLGAATAQRLLARGARVLIIDRLDDPTAAMNPPPKAAVYCRADVTSEDEVTAAMAVAEKTFGGLDAAVNCAGIGFAARTYNWNKDSTSGVEDFFRLLQVNAGGTFNVSRLAARLMAKNGQVVAAAPTKTRTTKTGGAKATVADVAEAPLSSGDGARGVIVNTSSMSALDGQPMQVAYATSKAAVAAMTLPMARDLAPIGIRVCCIAPGYFDSPMCLRASMPPHLMKFLADHNRAIYRLGRPDEFAQTVEAVLLNRMLNGVTIRLDAANRGFFYNRRKKAVPLAAVTPATTETAQVA